MLASTAPACGAATAPAAGDKPLSVELVLLPISAPWSATAGKRAGGKGERVQKSGKPADGTRRTDGPHPSHNARPRGCANDL